MANDMDIEMDLDVGLIEEDLATPEAGILPENDVLPQYLSKVNGTSPNDNAAPDALQPAPKKVHLRGLDNLTTKDIITFASEYFSEGAVERVEWIDDTSANLVYATAEIAQEALTAFAAVEQASFSQVPVLQTIPAKSVPFHPHTNIELRLAVIGDRKQAGARERSRFYLFNPEHDPAERRKLAGYKGGTKYRNRDDGGYRSRRYDEREQQKRQNDNEASGFDDSLYDDDEAALAERAAKRSNQLDTSSSSSDSKGRELRRVRFRGASGKELFPDRRSQRDRNTGRLRDRSASPVGDRDGENGMEEMGTYKEKQSIAASENRLRAQIIKSKLREESSTKELFPHKAGINHRRSDAFDAADETADLFANKMPIPLLDGSGDYRPTNGLALDSRISKGLNGDEPGEFSIRGAANVPTSTGFAIKGTASDSAVRELFPARTGGNAGKELFSDRLEGRGGRRQKAEDLFY